jgi:DNA recombination protein RmuC
MLVSPTTLLVALRTIATCGATSTRVVMRNRLPIGPRKLYDKMRLFVDDMSAIGQSLDKAQDNYRQAMKKLSSGRGNVLSQAEAFRSLGVEIKREINPELAEQATTQDEEYRLRSVPETQQDASYPDGEAVNQQSN